MQVITREMLPSDWESVSTIYKSGMDSNVSTFDTVLPTYEQWDTMRIKKCRLVAECGGAVVGWAALSPYSSREAYKGVAEVSIYVAPDFMSQGVGSLLLNTITDISEQNGFWTLQSNIIAENIKSINLHKKCGFREVGYRENISRDRFGNWHNTILMERRNGLNL